MEKNLAGATATSHVDKCTAGEVGVGCHKMANDRTTVTRAELISALEGVRDADDRLHRLRRRIFWGLAWRRTLLWSCCYCMRLRCGARRSETTHKDSGIVNDANLLATETVGDAAYPFKLFQRVITVSLETMKIVRALPRLDSVVGGKS